MDEEFFAATFPKDTTPERVALSVAQGLGHRWPEAVSLLLEEGGEVFKPPEALGSELDPKGRWAYKKFYGEGPLTLREFFELAAHPQGREDVERLTRALARFPASAAHLEETLPERSWVPEVEKLGEDHYRYVLSQGRVTGYVERLGEEWRVEVASWGFRLEGENGRFRLDVDLRQADELDLLVLEGILDRLAPQVREDLLWALSQGRGEVEGEGLASRGPEPG